MDDLEGKKFHFDLSCWEDPVSFEHFSLYQVGDLSCEPDFETGLHEQLCYEISYVVRGRGEFFLDGVRYDLRQGDVFLCKPGQMHDFRADHDDPLRFYYLAFTLSPGEGAASPYGLIERAFGQVRTPQHCGGDAAAAAFSALIKEFNAPGAFSPLLIEHCMAQVILQVYRLFAGERTHGARHAIDYKNKTVYAIVSYIDNNISNIGEMRTIAKALNYSYSYLAHLFAAEVGMSIQSYYNLRRIETAQELLREEGMSIADIAEYLQYSSVHSFSTAFKNAAGISPGAYRRQYGGEDADAQPPDGRE